MGLRAQFNLAILTALLVGFACAGTMLHRLFETTAAFDYFMASLGWVLLMVLILLNLLLHYLVIKPVAKVSDFARAVSLGQMDAQLQLAAGPGEIGSLSASFNRMRRSLDTAMEMLGA